MSSLSPRARTSGHDQNSVGGDQPLSALDADPTVLLGDVSFSGLTNAERTVLRSRERSHGALGAGLHVRIVRSGCDTQNSTLAPVLWGD